MERLNERKEYEKDKAVLESERSYQERLLKANDEYNGKIKELYDELSNVRRVYEDKVKELELELKEASKPKNNKNK